MDKLKNCSKIWNNDITAASDHAALSVSVMQWRHGFILPNVQHKECSYGFWDKQEVS